MRPRKTICVSEKQILFAQGSSPAAPARFLSACNETLSDILFDDLLVFGIQTFPEVCLLVLWTVNCPAS